LAYPDGTTYYDASANLLLDVTTYITKVTSATIGTVTPVSVQIVDISGVYDKISIVRNGVNSYSYYDQTPTPTFTDSDTKLITGLKYTYVIVPSKTNAQGKPLDGAPFTVGTVTIP
jgi:hypothetical protein